MVRQTVQQAARQALPVLLRAQVFSDTLLSMLHVIRLDTCTWSLSPEPEPELEPELALALALESVSKPFAVPTV